MYFFATIDMERDPVQVVDRAGRLAAQRREHRQPRSIQILDGWMGGTMQ